MSIIQEALKKAQGYIEAKKDSQLPQKERETGYSIKHAKRAKIILSLVSIVLLILVVGQMLFVRKTTTDFKGSIASRQEVTYKKLDAAMDIKPAAVSPVEGPSSAAKPIEYFTLKPNPPELILNGIMYLPECPQAIINNVVVTVGDIIKGAVVRKINKNNVVLDYNNVEITLDLKN
jgi:type II secretory pathway component PulC